MLPANRLVRVTAGFWKRRRWDLEAPCVRYSGCPDKVLPGVRVLVQGL
jgi:hypothetical protein